MKIMIYIFCIIGSLYSQTFSKETFIVPVGEPKVENDTVALAPVSIQTPLLSAQVASIQNIIAIIQNDLNFYRRIFNVELTSASTEALKLKSIRYHITSEAYKKDQSIVFKYRFHDLKEEKKEFEEEVTLSFPISRDIVHKISSRIYKEITGKEGIFHSKILFVSDLGSKGLNVVKELYIMDFDGHNPRKLTNHKGIVVSPAISPSGTKVLYSLIRSGISRNKNMNLYELDLLTSEVKTISSLPGINSGAIYSQNGESIYLTLSHQGSAEI